MWYLSRLGGTRKYGVFGGSPRKFAVREEERCAQSRGLCPGVKRTFLEGLEGMEVCVGGGASPKEELGGVRFGTGPREGTERPRVLKLLVFGEGRGGGGIKFEAGGNGFRSGGCGDGLEARCAELNAGNEGGGRLSVSSSSS